MCEKKNELPCRESYRARENDAKVISENSVFLECYRSLLYVCLTKIEVSRICESHSRQTSELVST